MKNNHKISKKEFLEKIKKGTHISVVPVPGPIMDEAIRKVRWDYLTECEKNFMHLSEKEQIEMLKGLRISNIKEIYGRYNTPLGVYRLKKVWNSK